MASHGRSLTTMHPCPCEATRVQDGTGTPTPKSKDKQMFHIDKHRADYHHDFVTVVPGVIPEEICASLRLRVNLAVHQGLIQLVDHHGKGTGTVSDLGGRYLHHIFKGEDVRLHL